MLAGCGTNRGLTHPARRPAAACLLWLLHLLPSLPPPAPPAHPGGTLEILTSLSSSLVSSQVMEHPGLCSDRQTSPSNECTVTEGPLQVSQCQPMT